MPSSGWFKLYRAIFDHPVLSGDTASRVHAFADFVGMAEFEPTRRRVGTNMIELDRGEVLASVRYLCQRWRWSKGKVQRFLACLEDERMVSTARETPSGTVYLVVNYDAYQEVRDTERDGKRDSNGTGAGQQRDKEKKERTLELETPTAGKEPIPLRVEREIDRDLLASEIIRAANKGMGENPAIGDFNPILAGHASRQNVMDWLADGIPAALLKRVVYERARDYPPNARYGQINSMRYFESAVRDAYEIHRSNQTEVSDVGNRADDRGVAAKGRGAQEKPFDRYAHLYEGGDTRAAS